MLSKKQKAWLKGLQRQAKLGDEDYRALFPKVTGWDDCCSSTDGRLTQEHMDELVAELKALARPADLKAQMRQQRQPRVRREHPLAEVQACLALYHPDPAGYLATVMADKFGVPTEGSLTIEGLSDKPRFRTGAGGKLIELPSELMQLVMTLWARVQPMRRAAGHSLHDMKTRAGVPCYCATYCRMPAHVVVSMPTAEAVTADADESGAAELVATGDGEEPF